MSVSNDIAKLVSTVLTSFIVGGICTSTFLGWRTGNAESEMVRQLRAHNDSVTTRVSGLLHTRDSLLVVAAGLVRTSDSASAVADSLSVRIRVLERRRVGVPTVIKQLPDTGVATKFQELIR